MRNRRCLLRILQLLIVVHGSDGIEHDRTAPAFVFSHGATWRQRPASTTSRLLSTRTTDELPLTRQAPSGATVLSQDPLVYLIPNLLSDEGCLSYKDRVLLLKDQNRTMTRSNPPQVSLDMAKLWPLPILSLGAGVPPYIHMIEKNESINLSAVFVPIAIAMSTSALLAFGVLSLIRRFSDSSSRTSDAMAMNLAEDVPFVRELVERVSQATNHPWHAWEAPVVTRYEPGAIFARHGDASPTKGSEWSDVGGQRVVTAICYLNNVSSGGETFFDRLGLSVKPTLGSALVFFPSNADTLEADDRTTHESLPPMEEKWIVQMFGRVGPRVPPPLGLPDMYAKT